MTVFTKNDASEKKPVENALPSAPEVVITDPIETQNEIIKQSRQETHDEYFTRKKRSSSFGPLSIVRLTPSPLCRTPSPPRSYSPEQRREQRRLARHFNIAVLISVICFSFLLGFAYRAYVHSHVDQSIRRIFGRSPPPPIVELSDAPKSQALQAPAKTEVLSADGKPMSAIFVHDLRKGLTAIVDTKNGRCFIKKFSHPSLRQMQREAENGSAVVNQYYKVQRRLRDRDISRMNSLVVYRHCARRPSFMLNKKAETMVMSEGRWKRSAEEKLPSENVEFTEVLSDGTAYVDHIQFDDKHQ